MTRVESLRPGFSIGLRYGNRNYSVGRWREFIDSALPPQACFDDGHGALYEQKNYRYLCAWPCQELLRTLLLACCQEAGIEITELPESLRLRRRGEICFAFNYGVHATALAIPDDTRLLLGENPLPAAGVAAWRK